MMIQNRRDFIKKSALGSSLALSIPSIVSAAFSAPEAKKITLRNGDVVLFQGDSITDARRDKETKDYHTIPALGNGYTMLAASHLLLQHASKNLQIYNKGISGNKVHQLAERWEKDCLELKPNVLSILIGVNDYWHTLNPQKYTGTIETYRNDFRALLDRTLKHLPGVQLIIGEPFAVVGVKAVTPDWYPAFDAYRAAAKEIATAYKAVFIPYQSVFDEAIKKVPATYWTYDGVHTTLAGAELMAAAWLKAVKEL